MFWNCGYLFASYVIYSIKQTLMIIVCLVDSLLVMLFIVLSKLYNNSIVMIISLLVMLFIVLSKLQDYNILN